MDIEIYFDGACHNIPNQKNKFGVGVAVYVDKEYSPILSKALPGKDGTSNISEWFGLLETIKSIKDLESRCKVIKQKIGKVSVYGDSQLIVNQYNGVFQVKDEDLKILSKEVFKEIKTLENKITVSWIPRENNTKADELSKIGIERARDDNYILVIKPLTLDTFKNKTE